jgi:GLPGLI family protein
MKKHIIIYAIILSFACSFFASAQKTEGIISFERKTYYSKIIARLPYLSQEEKDRVKMRQGSDDEWKEKMKLVFSPTQSLYTYLNDQAESEDGTYAWRNDDLIITRDFEKEKKTNVIEMLGKTYIIEDSLHTPHWKVMNQIKDVAGYICMKAVAEDTIKKQKITAWFTGDIPVQAGPELYFGLPGIILELDINDGDVVIEATKVEFKKLDKELILPKTKGKKIKDKDYDALLRNHIRDSIKSQRNPYWAIRY